MNVQNQDLTKVEFLLTLENNIIIQRFFNVKAFNPDSIESTDLYFTITNICEEIKKDLKAKTFDYLYEEQENYYGLDVVEGPEITKEEYFLLEIKLNDFVFISRIFDAHVYHPKARYSVDIRSKVRKILLELSEVLSSDDLDFEYSEMNFYNLIKE
jgi:hypothetical protein